MVMVVMVMVVLVLWFGRGLRREGAGSATVKGDGR